MRCARTIPRVDARLARGVSSPPPLPDPSRHPRSTDTFERSSPSQSYRVRVLDSEKFSKTQQLAEGARDFCDKVSQLNDIVKTVVEAVDQQARLPRAKSPRPPPSRHFFPALTAES